ncbi:MAG: hypothetical protein H7249_01380 [Chitinophagaceae bacterium]|nr:hypothetical protein [Oligoflexus sp.]
MVKALLVTSRVTFTPDNYDTLVIGLAQHPDIGGLLILDNSSRDLTLKGLALAGLGASGMGMNLLLNQYGLSHTRRLRAFEDAGKPVWILTTVNSPEALAIIKNHGFELVINARTRCIYKKAILDAPRLGCINIHHGLLPLQRGTSCDMWNLSEGKATGFSIHCMAEKIDDGPILTVVQVDDGSERNYTAYLKRGAGLELQEIKNVLTRLNQDENSIRGQPNISHPELKHRKTPNWRDIRAIRRSGFSL